LQHGVLEGFPMLEIGFKKDLEFLQLGCIRSCRGNVLRLKDATKKLYNCLQNEILAELP